MTTDATGQSGLVDESWQAYRYLADNAIDVVMEADLATVIRWVSPSIAEVLGWRPEDVVGRSAPDLVHPEDMPEIGGLVNALNEHAARVRARRVRLLCQDGTWKSLQLRGRPALDSSGAVLGHVITMQDTTERDEALWALAVLGEGNRLLATIDDEAKLLWSMCQTVVEFGGYRFAWYGKRMDDDERTVAPIAMFGCGDEELAPATITWGEGPHGGSPTGRCLRTGTTQIRQGVTEPGFEPWAAAAERLALHSSIAIPVWAGDVLDGAFTVHSESEQAFDERSQRILETLASDLGLGLERLRTRRQLEETTRLVAEQNAWLRGVFDSQFDPFVLLEPVRDEYGGTVDLRYVAVSDAALEFNRLSREQMIGHTLGELFPGQVADGSLAAYLDVIATGVPLVIDDLDYFHEPRQERLRLDIRAVKSGDGVAITFRDVTARHEGARALAASEERYRILAEHATDVVWQAEPDVGLVWSSESITRVLGWAPTEVLGRADDLIHPDDRDAAVLNLRGLARGMSVQGEARVACKDGTWKWVAYTASRAQIGGRVVDIASLHDIDEEVRARTALDFALGHDPLTGMAARPAMLQRIGEALGGLRGHQLAAVLCVGVDRLSAVNEAYTHAAGDLVLTAFATRIAEVVGRPDLIGRGAGVEFLIVQPGLVSGDEAAGLAQRILAAAKAPIAVGDFTIETSASIGIAIGDRTSDREQLARDASAAMGQAKAEGRDRIVFADASMADQARHRLDVERRLREALEEDRFLSFCQPVVDLTTGELSGYESLVRVQRPDGSIAPPAHFIPIAELSPIIADIDVVMLRKGLAALRRLPEPLTLAVNVSTVTLTRPGYAALIEQVVRESDVRASRLHLEVTETALLGDNATIVSAMQSIANLGPRWYVDDFGTGYSSISHLRDLPVSGLKLDVSFSAGIRAGQQTSIRLAQALAGLAGGLGLDTVAEGVETTEEAALLRAQGWRHGQGWLYGRPAPLP